MKLKNLVLVAAGKEIGYVSTKGDCLSKEGKESMEFAAAKMTRLLQETEGDPKILTSPALRAKASGEILQKALCAPQYTICAELRPHIEKESKGIPQALTQQISEQEAVILVTHPRVIESYGKRLQKAFRWKVTLPIPKLSDGEAIAFDLTRQTISIISKEVAT